MLFTELMATEQQLRIARETAEDEYINYISGLDFYERQDPAEDQAANEVYKETYEKKLIELLHYYEED